MALDLRCAMCALRCECSDRSGMLYLDVRCILYEIRRVKLPVVRAEAVVAPSNVKSRFTGPASGTEPTRRAYSIHTFRKWSVWNWKRESSSKRVDTDITLLQG